MMYSTAQIWTIIGIMAVGTFAIRFSFLGLIGDKPMPPLVARMLRFTPVAVLPGMVAPLLLGAGAQPDPIRFAAALVAVIVAYRRRNVVWGMGAGIAVFYAGLFATGAL